MNTLVKKFIASFVAALIIFGTSAAVISWALSMGRDDIYVPPETDGNEITLSGRSFNLLLIMTDFAPESFNDYDPTVVKSIFGIDYSGSMKPDGLMGYRKITAETMSIVRFDKERGELTYTHIPGNVLVSAKGVKTRIGSLISDYGTEFLVSKVHAITGIEIDSYFVFTPDSAATALDLIGDITYTIQRDMRYVDAEKGIDINIKAGTQKLDGEKTVGMLRFDGYGNIGVTRDATVCGYIKRFVNKLSTDFTYEEIRGIMDLLLGMNNTASNFTFEDSEESIRLLSESEGLEVTELPLVGNVQIINGEKYFYLDEEKTLDALKPYRKINTPDNIWK